ncbi:MAG: hypothetical protein EZS28_043471, partial [Streblomastix strix]
IRGCNFFVPVVTAWINNEFLNRIPDLQENAVDIAVLIVYNAENGKPLLKALSKQSGSDWQVG